MKESTIAQLKIANEALLSDIKRKNALIEVLESELASAKLQLQDGFDLRTQESVRSKKSFTPC